MDIKLLALLFLAGRVVSVVFIVWVLVRQMRLFSLAIPESVKVFRVQLFLMALAILSLNIVPTTIDLLTLFVPVDRPATVSLTGVVYGLSNNVLTAVLSFFVWLMYRTAMRSHKDQA